MSLTSFIIFGIMGLAALYAVIIMVFQIVRAISRKANDQDENEPLDQD